MTAIPLVLLVFDVCLFLVLKLLQRTSPGKHGSLLLSLLFFCSGMPALIYQIVWQRALFAIYGVNAESVAVVVTAFMLGLGLGSLLGGRLSILFPQRGVLIFAFAEFGVAVFGLASLPIFRWAAAHSAGAGLPAVVLYSLLLLLVPTMLMGATLPLLVEHLVQRTGQVGSSVSTLYFANTLGSAVACYLCAQFLLKNFGQTGAVNLAAIMNGLVGLSAYLLGQMPQREFNRDQEDLEACQSGPPWTPSVSLPLGMLLAAASGFIALGFEIAWFRTFMLASSDRAPAFALLLSTYLAGIAAGSYLCEALIANFRRLSVLRLAGGLLLLAGALSAYLPPLEAALMVRGLHYLTGAPAFFAAAALIGLIFPLLCQAAVHPDRRAGRGVSLIYVANIVGSASGSLGIGFGAMQHYGLESITIGLGVAAVLLGLVFILCSLDQLQTQGRWTAALAVPALAAVLASVVSYPLIFERLIFGPRPEAKAPFAQVVENRNGIIGVTRDAAVFGGGVYDGYFNVDPVHDVNLVVRIYTLSFYCPAPKRILTVGLASGSWAQILANHPQVESLDAVEINPGYLDLIPKYGNVRSLLKNPKVHIYVDDGRRWLRAHPQEHYDVIVANSTFNWRDHSTGLLSTEFLQLVRRHLSPGGVYFFNSTESDETMATALAVFPYALRVINFVAASDSPLSLDKERWMSLLSRYRIDGKQVFDPADPNAQRTLEVYRALADSMKESPRFLGFESGESLRARLRGRAIITDDNMGREWQNDFTIPWR